MKRWGRVAAAGVLAANAGCSTLGSVKNTFFGGPPEAQEAPTLTGFIGSAVADEPRAALVGRDVLARGGSAADAAVAMGFMLGVTLPSRAGLGGGGACLAYQPNRNGPGAGSPEAVLFTPVSPAQTVGQMDRPASVPTMARGLYALHVRYGRLPFEGLLTPAEQAARFGIPLPRALLNDLSVVAGPLLQDPAARAVFAPGGQPLADGATLLQPDLGATIAQLRTAGVGDLYQGALAKKLAAASQLAGGGLSAEAMRGVLPRVAPPLVSAVGRDRVAFLPPPADGGVAAQAVFNALEGGAGAGQALAAGNAAVSRVRGAAVGVLPASTGWLALDRDGEAVACVATMDNLFGTGRIAPGTGMLLAAAPRPAPLLAAGLAWNPNLDAFRAAATGTGQDGAGLAAGLALFNAMRSAEAMPQPVPEPGRANVIACARYLPDSDGSCRWAVDPRTAGLAAGGN